MRQQILRRSLQGSSMAKKSSWNPVAFVPTQVTLITSALYVALFAVLLWVHHVVPSAPSNVTPVKGINLTQVWLDLDFVSDGYHPVDSRRNEAVREYLFERVDRTLKSNGVEYQRITSRVGDINSSVGVVSASAAVTVFEDYLSNVTFVDDFRKVPWTCYSESTNLMVYIRGKEDEPGEWWSQPGKYQGQGGVLVNAHYDSVSSGFGATDDGVGVVTILQLISYFTREHNQPKRGIVALFNNGEENGLYGAHEYLQHPLSEFTHTFLNLEGAGAGGRATLFRSTDAEVTQFYSHSPYPFGAVVSGDGFKRGFIRSGTDYSVFNGDNGMRGLDVAFFEPRARYHTNQDDARDTSIASLWHMLSASLATMKAMTSYTGDEFEGIANDRGRLAIGTGSNGVWFDLFGRTFAVLTLPTMFAISVALLVAAPVLLLVLQIILAKLDRWYPLSRRQYLHDAGDENAVHFSGLRGLFRFPVAFVAATVVVLALAYLLAKFNPYIAYSSEYAVWTMSISAWIAIAWFFLAGADRIRPTALQRMYCLIWLYSLTWVALVAVTVGANNFQIASGYFVVVYNASVFVALLVSYIELFAMPTKTAFMEHVLDADEEIERRSLRPVSQSSRAAPAQDDDEASESTSLLRGRSRTGAGTFTRTAKARHPDTDGTLEETEDPYLTKAYGDEQAWSSRLPQWTWIIQLLALAPINIILVGQIALLITSAIHMTPADGNPVLPIYLIVAGLTVVLLLPLIPFLHRFSYRIPTLLFFVFVGCLIYNLLAFPFSPAARLKIYFVQQVDLNSGVNNVTLVGLDGYLQDIISELPSSAGRPIMCSEHANDTLRQGTATCSWHGLAPHVVAEHRLFSNITNSTRPNYASWIDYNVTHTETSALFSIRGRNTKQCRLIFDKPVSSVVIDDAASDPHYHSVAEDGSSQVRLFSRTWDKTFHVNVSWSGDDAVGQTGKVLCGWSDANQYGVIPAYDEIMRFQPVWSAVSKASDGLVEGFKQFRI